MRTLEELKTPSEDDEALKKEEDGTVLVLLTSEVEAFPTDSVGVS